MSTDPGSKLLPADRSRPFLFLLAAAYGQQVLGGEGTGVILMTTGAACAVGVLLGFLFAIPRTVRSAESAGGKGGESVDLQLRYQFNIAHGNEPADCPDYRRGSLSGHAGK